MYGLHQVVNKRMNVQCREDWMYRYIFLMIDIMYYADFHWKKITVWYKTKERKLARRWNSPTNRFISAATTAQKVHAYL